MAVVVVVVVLVVIVVVIIGIAMVTSHVSLNHHGGGPALAHY